MKITCDKCEYVIDRDKYVGGMLVEEYKNIFGTTCPNCKNFIKSFKKPFLDEIKEMKMKILREEMREKLRKNIKRRNVMSIEEKPQLLEFNCTLEGMEDISWNIKYDPNDKIALHISGNGQTFHCPVELFNDVTFFLQSKGILKPNINTRTVQTPGIPDGSFGASLLPPKIDNKESVSSPVISDPTVVKGPPLEALLSFDITENAKPTSSEGAKTAQVGNIITPDAKSEIVITPDTKSEIVSRSVIRTRVNKKDPLSAEKEGATLRGDSSKKAIKKRHRVEN